MSENSGASASDFAGFGIVLLGVAAIIYLFVPTGDSYQLSFMAGARRACGPLVNHYSILNVVAPESVFGRISWAFEYGSVPRACHRMTGLLYFTRLLSWGAIASFIASGDAKPAPASE